MPSPVKEPQTVTIPITLTEKQQRFVDHNEYYGCYVAGHGGGKTTALLAAAVRAAETGANALFVSDNPNHPFRQLASWVEGNPDAQVRYNTREVVLLDRGIIRFAWKERDLKHKVRSSEFGFIGTDIVDPLDFETFTILETRLRQQPRQYRETVDIDMEETWGDSW